MPGLPVSEIIEKSLSDKMEGKLYEHIWTSYVYGEYWINKDFYSVKNGKVIIVNDGKEQKTGDTLETLMNDCHLAGTYDATKVYKPIKKVLKPAELKKKLGL